MILYPEIECADRQQLHELQSKRSRNRKTGLRKCAFYRNKLKEKGIEPGDIQSVDQLKDLPFTTKIDLRNNYPFGLFTVPQTEVVRIHASSGTTGKPTVVGYTRRDIEIWAEVVARGLTMAGIDKDDTIQIAYGYGAFTGGLGLHYGAEKVGATVIPISTGNTKKQIQFMTDFNATVLACTPSYAAYLGESILQSGLSPKDTTLRIGVFGAEPWTNEMRLQIEKLLNIKAYDIYGLSEIIGRAYRWNANATAAIMFAKIISFPKSSIRKHWRCCLTVSWANWCSLPSPKSYATDSLSYTRSDTFVSRKCACGRTLVRMEKCLSRSDDMLIIRGVNIFPSQVEAVLMEMVETSPHYQIIVGRENNLDTLEIRVEINEHFWSDSIRELENIRRRIDQSITSVLGIIAVINLVEPHSIERSEGKQTCC